MISEVIGKDRIDIGIMLIGSNVNQGSVKAETEGFYHVCINLSVFIF